jgi:hypothetical protein
VGIYCMQSLPRAILRWMQELDLTNSVVNVQRDLANGYVMVEIVSRYFPHDISVRSVDPGINLMTRNDNWNQLLKSLRRNGIFSISQELANDVIYHKPGAAVEAMVELYTALTSRKRPSVIGVAQCQLSEGFAQPTASVKAKDSSINRIVDDDERRQKTAETLLDHFEYQVKQRDRPKSIDNKRGNRSRKRSGSLHRISNDESQASVEVKHIEIKAFTNTDMKQAESITCDIHHTETNLRSWLESQIIQLGEKKKCDDPYWFLDCLKDEAFNVTNLIDIIESSLPLICEMISQSPADFLLIDFLSKTQDKPVNHILTSVKSSLEILSPNFSKYIIQNRT